jgi:uncharacterized protein YndB with AHSA1/START domain
MSTKVEKPLRLRIERTFRAERQRVWDAWTKPEQLQRWSAPEGLKVTDGDLDLRVGGRWRVVMEGGGQKYMAVGTYREITPPERLVYTHSWTTDETPVETLVTLSFHADGVRTRVVLEQEGFGEEGSRSGHEEGWSSTLDVLERYLHAESA